MTAERNSTCGRASDRKMHKITRTASKDVTLHLKLIGEIRYAHYASEDFMFKYGVGGTDWEFLKNRLVQWHPLN